MRCGGLATKRMNARQRIAFEGVDRQMRDAVRGIDDQVSQIGLRVYGAAGFAPLRR